MNGLDWLLGACDDEFETTTNRIGDSTPFWVCVVEEKELLARRRTQSTQSTRAFRKNQDRQTDRRNSHLPGPFGGEGSVF